MRIPALVVLAGTLSACQADASDPSSPPGTHSTIEIASTFGGDTRPSAAEVERGRHRGLWRSVAPIDTTGRAAAEAAHPETPDQIASDSTVWDARLHLPLGGDIAGPSVLKAQVLLNRAGFSPGALNGRWSDSTERALAWFQSSVGLVPTGILTHSTLRALTTRAGAPRQIVISHVLTENDVAGPFAPLPSDLSERATADHLSYESLPEKLGERFHADPALLARLNAGISLDSLTAGDSLRVPAVGAAAPDRQLDGEIARLVISVEGGYLHALAQDGSVLYHAPVTVGAAYAPTAEDAFAIEAIVLNPVWVDPESDVGRLPPGPNSIVGTVWIAFSEAHYGIHGTRAPEAIGVPSSSGSVRLTNWDAANLARLLEPGTPVRFRDVEGRR
ncbi:MAG: hypothetical protein Rubg2KO_31200 [Rubricoccaceae bacterium]